MTTNETSRGVELEMQRGLKSFVREAIYPQVVNSHFIENRLCSREA